MTWNDDRDGIPIVGHADGAACLRVADGFGDIAIAPGLAVWNFEQGTPACDLKFGSAQIQGNRELVAGSFNIEASHLVNN